MPNRKIRDMIHEKLTGSTQKNALDLFNWLAWSATDYSDAGIDERYKKIAW